MKYYSHFIVLIALSFFMSNCDNEKVLMNEWEEIDHTGTSIDTFSLLDGFVEYPSFAIIDSLILIKVPNQGNLKKLRAVFSHNGKDVFVNKVRQISGETENDFSDPTQPVIYTVVSSEGKSKNYAIELFDIPVICLNTDNNTPIQNREEWIPAKIKIVEDYGKLFECDLLVKGRGNGSWTNNNDKRGYSIKFDSKETLLGLPKSKRWALLGQTSDWTKIRSALCYKLSSIAGFDWTPYGYNVEFVLNDSLRGNYFLSEVIRVEKNRINIQEMAPADTIGEALTGGVLFEVSSDYDEQYKFRTDIGDYPFMFQNPDKNLHPKQFEYFKNYINTLEEILYSDERLMSCEYHNYMNIDTFIRWWLVNELTLNMEESWFVKNYYMYKDRGYDKKLTAGPPWDFDWGTFWKKNERTWLCKEKFWYGRLFTSPQFVLRVKDIWKEFKDSYVRNNMDSFYNTIKNYNKFSVTRDHYLFPFKEVGNEDDGMLYEDACQYIKAVFDNHMLWMDEEISKM